MLGGAAAVAAVAACATALPGVPKPARKIGMLSSGAAVGPDEPVHAAFRDGMRANGFVEGPDYRVEYRFGVFDADLLLRWARELVALGTEVIVTSSTGATQAARVATSDIPIVMVVSHDPVDAGVVPDLAKPGGNVTGQSLAGALLMPMQLDYLGEIAPLRRLGYLSPSLPSFGPGYPSVTDAFERSMRSAAAALSVEVIAPKIRGLGDVAPALAALATEPIDALYVIESPMWFVPGTRRPISEIVDLAVRRRLPSMGGHRSYAQAGLLASYGDARPYVDLYRTATRYVAQILGGVPPGDLAIGVPPLFELAVNAKTASAMALEVPRYVMDRAGFVVR